MRKVNQRTKNAKYRTHSTNLLVNSTIMLFNSTELPMSDYGLASCEHSNSTLMLFNHDVSFLCYNVFVSCYIAGQCLIKSFSDPQYIKFSRTIWKKFKSFVVFFVHRCFDENIFSLSDFLFLPVPNKSRSDLTDCPGIFDHFYILTSSLYEAFGRGKTILPCWNGLYFQLHRFVLHFTRTFFYGNSFIRKISRSTSKVGF